MEVQHKIGFGVLWGVFFATEGFFAHLTYGVFWASTSLWCANVVYLGCLRCRCGFRVSDTFILHNLSILHDSTFSCYYSFRDSNRLITKLTVTLSKKSWDQITLLYCPIILDLNRRCNRSSFWRNPTPPF